MNKIYEQAKDLHIVATMIYGKDNNAYVDVECTKQFIESELKEVFIKGALIEIDGNLFKAVNFHKGVIDYIDTTGQKASLSCGPNPTG